MGKRYTEEDAVKTDVLRVLGRKSLPGEAAIWAGLAPDLADVLTGAASVEEVAGRVETILQYEALKASGTPPRHREDDAAAARRFTAEESARTMARAALLAGRMAQDPAVQALRRTFLGAAPLTADRALRVLTSPALACLSAVALQGIPLGAHTAWTSDADGVPIAHDPATQRQLGVPHTRLEPGRYRPGDRLHVVWQGEPGGLFVPIPPALCTAPRLRAWGPGVVIDAPCLPESPHDALRRVAVRVRDQTGWPAEAVPWWLLTATAAPLIWPVQDLAPDAPPPPWAHAAPVLVDGRVSPERLGALLALMGLASPRAHPFEERTLQVVLWVEAQRDLWGTLPPTADLYAAWEHRWRDLDRGPRLAGEDAALNHARRAHRFRDARTLRQTYERAARRLLQPPVCT